MKKETMIFREKSDAVAFMKRLTTFINNGFKKPIQVTIQDVTTKRSLDQNALYWMTIGDIARETENNKDHVHEYYLDVFCPEKEITFNGVSKWKKSTKLLTKGEMKIYWERVRAHAQTELDIYCRHPDDRGRE